MYRAKRKNTVCAIGIGLFMAKVEGIPLRMIAIIMGSKRSFRSTLAMNKPMKSCT
jgi:hypothetical protein